MVCNRCLLVVRQQLQTINFAVTAIGLGGMETEPEPNADRLYLNLGDKRST